MNEQGGRNFIAVPLPEKLKLALSAGCSLLRAKLPFRKWVEADDYHVTLQFLGDTPLVKRHAVEKALRAAVFAEAGFSLALEGLGTFGRPGAPSILWAGVGGNVEPLLQLQRQVAGVLAPLGFEPENRRFHPHVTLARSYAGSAPLTRDALEQIQTAFTITEEARHFTADRIVLYQSHLGRRPMYEPVAMFAFE